MPIANTCGLVNLSSTDTCAVASGGLEMSAIIGCSDVATSGGFTLNSSGQITAITLVSAKLFAKMEFDDDNSAYFNQEGVRTNKKFEVSQKAFFKFGGTDATKDTFIRALSECCCLYVIHFYNNGLMRLQGLDVHETAVAGTWESMDSKMKAVANIKDMSDTGENEDRIEVEINSTGRNFAPIIAASRATVLAYLAT